MELRQIRYFIAVAEEENFSAAAQRLFVSQPPVTRQIQKLEAELDVQLFERTPRGVELTPAGSVFLQEARQILTRARLASERSRAAALGETGTLEIAYFGSPIYSIIPRIVREFRRKNPRVSVSLNPLTKREQVEAVRDGKVHAGFSRYFQLYDDLEVETVAAEKLVLAVPVEHEMAGRDRVTLKQLKDQQLILFPRGGRPSFADEVIRILRNGGVEPNIGHEASDLSSALALTAAGLGVCPVPDSVTQLRWPNLRFLALKGLAAISPVNCIYSSENQSPILIRFLDTLRGAKASL